MISDHELFEKLKFFDWLMRKRHFLNKNANLHKSFGRGRIISVLAIENNLSTRELANRIGVRVSSLNEILAKMTEDGLVERIPLKEDRRVKINHLTDQGRELVMNSKDSPLFECLTDKEREELAHILDKLSLRLEESFLETEDESVIECCRMRREALERLLDKV